MKNKGKYILKKSLKVQAKTATGLRVRIFFSSVKISLLAALVAFPFLMGNLLKSPPMLAQKNIKNQVQGEEKSPVPAGRDFAAIPLEREDTLRHQNHTSAVYRVGYVDLTNTGTLYVSASTILACEGSLVTTSSGNTENNGDVYVKGDWINNGTYTKDNGKVTFWDTDNQDIDGTSNTVFYNAEVNKSSGVVTMNLNTEVSNRLTLTNGVVDLNSNTLTISNAATTGISYSTGYIKSEKTDNSSKVQWNMGSTTGAHVIPFGTAGGTLLPLSLNQTAGTIGNVTVSTYPTAPNNMPYPTTPDSVTHLRDANFNDNSANVVDRFWQINKSGASGTLTITFTYATAEEPANGDAGLVAQLYNVPNRAWVAPFGSQSSNTVTNTVTAPEVSNFGPFTLSKFTSPLPITLVEFNAALNDKQEVLLDWTTASEINNDFFTIQRSKDLKEIESIADVPGAGNSNKMLHYKTIDTQPLPGNSYYRLRQTDFDGTSTFSEWRHINISETILGKSITLLNVYPNPFYDEFRIDFSVVVPGKVTIILLNALGQNLWADEIQASQGRNSYHFNPKGALPPGQYILNLVYKGEVRSLRLLKRQ